MSDLGDCLVDELKADINHLKSQLAARDEEITRLQGALPWKLFYKDGLNLKQIAEQLKCSIYDLSPWLTAPLTRCEGHPFQTALQAAIDEATHFRNAASAAEARLEEARKVLAKIATFKHSARDKAAIAQGFLDDHPAVPTLKSTEVKGSDEQQT